MSVPAVWTQVPVTGTYTYRNGDPLVGKALAFASAQVVVVGGEIIVPKVIKVRLDASGSIPADFTLPSTNDPDLDVTGWAYTVTECWQGGRTFEIFVEYDAVSIDMATVSPAVDAQSLVSIEAAAMATATARAATEAAAAAAASATSAAASATAADASEVAAAASAAESAAAVDVLRSDLASTAEGKGSELVSFLPDGTGAVASDLRRKAREVVSVLDFIPVSEHAALRARTSTYDCLADINAAIAAVGAYGGTIYFPPGLYHVSDTVVVDLENVTLAGAGCHSRSRQSVAAIRASAATGIRWAGASAPSSGTPVVSFQSGATMPGLYGGGLYNIGIDGNGQAPIGLQLASANHGKYTQVTVFGVTEASYYLSAATYAVSSGVGATQFNHFEQCYVINYVFDGGTGVYYDNNARGWWLRQDTTIAGNTGDPSENTFVKCTGITSKGPFLYIESVGQNTFISCSGAAQHPSGPDGGYNCVLGSTDQDSNPGIALHGHSAGVARYSLFLWCEMSIVAKASTSATGGGAYGIHILGKSNGNNSPAPVIEQGVAGSNPATIHYSTLGSRTVPSQHRFGGTLTVVTELAGSPLTNGPTLYLHKRVDAGAATMGLGEVQWRMTNDAGTQSVNAGKIAASITSATAGAETVSMSLTPMYGGAQTAVAMTWQNGVSIPGGTLGGGAFRGFGTLALTDNLWIGTNRILTSQQTGWNAPTGTLLRGTYDSATATTAQTAQTLAALLTDLRAHGLIGA